MIKNEDEIRTRLSQNQVMITFFQKLLMSCFHKQNRTINITPCVSTEKNRPAGRRSRLAAAFIDMVINLTATIPFWFLIADIQTFQRFPVRTGACALIYGYLSAMAIHGFFLLKNAQTIGKKLMGIKIIDRHNRNASLVRVLFLRELFRILIASVPGTNNVLSIIDAAFIFGKDRRCIHDFVAGTRVVRA